MKIIPLKKYLLVEQVKREKTETGIILPDSDIKNETQIGRVIAVGEECKIIVGTKIIYPEYSLSRYRRDNTVYLLVKEQDALATIDESDDK